MQYTKPMIELVYEIRRRVPSDMKPGVKLANPQLFIELSAHYKRGAHTVTKALIKELFTLAGEEWLEFLSPATPPENRHNAKAYRGVVSLNPAPSTTANEQTSDESSRAHSKKRIYRGQVIA